MGNSLYFIEKFGIGRAEITFFISEAICILFYGLFTEYGMGASEEAFVDKSSAKTTAE